MSALGEIRQIMKGTPIASEWAQKAAATRKEKRAQLMLPVSVLPAPSDGEPGDDDWPTTDAIGESDEVEATP